MNDNNTITFHFLFGCLITVDKVFETAEDIVNRIEKIKSEHPGMDIRFEIDLR